VTGRGKKWARARRHEGEGGRHWRHGRSARFGSGRAGGRLRPQWLSQSLLANHRSGDDTTTTRQGRPTKGIRHLHARPSYVVQRGIEALCLCSRCSAKRPRTKEQRRQVATTPCARAATQPFPDIVAPAGLVGQRRQPATSKLTPIPPVSATPLTLTKRTGRAVERFTGPSPDRRDAR